ncbi:MAG TPA: glycosyltransferase [Polyangiaceae bacterium]|jgi:SAM-dependent methyltransferase|nr:glycosyltransferase [Polyangiaceae bacterium]
MSPEWREYFLALLHGDPRVAAARRFVRTNICGVMRRLVPQDARVLEVGVGGGQVLAALPNQVRHGIDLLPEAIEASRRLDPTMRVDRADVLTFSAPERYDAIICDRLLHTVPDVQRMLENLAAHIEEDGRIYLTCFNFLWGLFLGSAVKLGVTESRPAENWFSESALEDVFTLVGLEAVHYEDHVLVPADVPLLNKFVAQLPGVRSGALYRTYVLRHRRVHRAPNPGVSVIVPARNESENVIAAVARTPVMGAWTEIVFVEGGSTDGTWEQIQKTIASYRGPLRLSAYKQTGKGKGDAVRLGFDKAKGDILMILDADLTVPPEDLPKFYDAMASGLTDYVQGTRMVYPMEDEAMRLLNKFGNVFFAKTFTYLLDQRINDTLCGTKVLWKKDYERLARQRSYFGELDPFGDFDLIFGARRLHLKLMEIPIRYRSRVYGETNISRFRDGALLLRMTALAARKIKFA